MPPKPKFTKEEIVSAALDLVSKKGMDSLTARELGIRLGSSARPIFTVFNSMEEVQDAVRAAALTRFEGYAQKVPDKHPAYLRLAMQMVLFAKEEPKLYLLRFLPENQQGELYEDMYSRLGIIVRHCVDALQRDYALSSEEASDIFRHMWMYTFGVGTLCATGGCDVSPERFLENLERDFKTLMHMIRSVASDMEG